jgi:2-hydroxychromene-2-carboxylate isomerase
MIRCTYYLDVLSQWCYIAEFALEKLRSVEGGNVGVSCVLVPIDPEILPTHDEQLRVYRRSRSISGVATKAWIADDVRPNTWHANAVTLAASLLGVPFEDVRKRVAEAALLEGMHLANPGEALNFVSSEFGLDPVQLRQAIVSEQIRSQLEANRSAFVADGLKVRPSFVLRNEIDDHIVLGGQYEFGILSAAVQSLKADEAGYRLFERDGERRCSI